jgi:hypothetical protein
MAHESKEGSDKRRRFKAGGGAQGAAEVTDKQGLNRIPQWLTQDKGLPDWLAGSVVVVGGGLILALVIWLLTVVWPAR